MSESTSIGAYVAKAELAQSELSFCGSGSGASSRVRVGRCDTSEILVPSPTSRCYSRLKPQYPEGVIGQTHDSYSPEIYSQRQGGGGGPQSLRAEVIPRLHVNWQKGSIFV